MIRKYVQTISLPVFLLAATLAPPNVFAAGPSGSLSCNGATVNSITVGVSYDTSSSAAANLYRYGAPANGQIASFRGPSGVASHQDSGLSGSYRYQLRTGSTILANVTCATAAPAPIPAPAPAPAQPAPAPAPRPVTPAPAPRPVTPAPAAPAPTPAPASPAAPTPAPVEQTPEPTTTGSSQVLPEDDENQDDEMPATVSKPENSDTSESTGTRVWPIAAGLLSALAILGGLYFWFVKRQQVDEIEVSGPSPIVSDRPTALSLPVPLPPTRDGVATAEYLPVPPESSTIIKNFDQGISNAFYPSRAPQPVPTQPKADDVPDMFSIANSHPESYGNPNYDQPQPTELPTPITAQPDAGPQPVPFEGNETTLNIDHSNRR